MERLPLHSEEINKLINKYGYRLLPAEYADIMNLSSKIAKMLVQPYMSGFSYTKALIVLDVTKSTLERLTGLKIIESERLNDNESEVRISEEPKKKTSTKRHSGI